MKRIATKALAALEEYLDSPAPVTVLVLEAAALDGRQKFSKLLQEKALIVPLNDWQRIRSGAGRADGEGSGCCD